MATYSHEYYKLNNIDSCQYDFSYNRQFRKLKNGQAYLEICEGLGIKGIYKENDKKYLIQMDNSIIEYDLFKVEYNNNIKK